MEDCPGGGPSWWRTVLVEDCPGGGLSWWRNVLVEDWPGGGMSWWRTGWLEDCPLEHRPPTSHQLVHHHLAVHPLQATPLVPFPFRFPVKPFLFCCLLRQFWPWQLSWFRQVHFWGRLVAGHHMPLLVVKLQPLNPQYMRWNPFFCGEEASLNLACKCCWW